MFDKNLLFAVCATVSLATANRGHAATQESDPKPATAVKAVLNGLQIGIDASSGNITKLAYPGAGTLLDTTSQKARMLDVAFPLADFEPFRLSSRYSTGAKIEQSDGAVTISWDRLGGSRPFEFPGKVSAVVKILADADGKSVVMKCTLRNETQQALQQVLFPDLAGFNQIAGPSETRFRSGGFVRSPFQDLQPRDNGQPYYDVGTSGDANFACKGIYDGSMMMRWFDLGNLSGGLSLWQRSWGNEPQDVAGWPLCRTRIELDEFEPKLRVMWMHQPNIPPGGTWESREYVLTPHAGGWAKGIETFRAWVQKNQRREFPLPRHVRESLGCRSVFMCKWQPRDGENDVLWKFADLPKVAAECKTYGVTEIVPWFWHDHFQVPLPPPFEHLGGERAFYDAVATCRQAGVAVSPFVSVVVLARPAATRYGLGLGGVWTYHPEFLPKIGPFYATGHNTGLIDNGNVQWQDEVLSGCKKLMDNGVTSFCWDVFESRKEEPNLYTLTRKIREAARKADPESSFSGESVNNLELESEVLDYTWNWMPSYFDCRAFTSAFAAPRINVNINHSVSDAVHCFMDNMFLNLMPRKTPYGVNGSGTIEQYPEFAKTLKRCADRRRQFLVFFTDGQLVGECMLSQDCPQTHVSGYVRPGKALLMILNESVSRPVSIRCDVTPWLKSSTGQYRVNHYDMDGRLLKSIEAADWHGETVDLEKNEITFFVIEAD